MAWSRPLHPALSPKGSWGPGGQITQETNLSCIIHELTAPIDAMYTTASVIVA